MADNADILQEEYVRGLLLHLNPRKTCYPIYPLTFDEFLKAANEPLYAYYRNIQKLQHIEDIFHNRLLEAFHYYLIIGGMPECVASWVKFKDPAKISQIHSEEAIEWLVSAGILCKVCNVSKMEHPLSAFDKLDCFKLFVFDTGLLKHMAGLDNSAILLKNDYQFKGPLMKNYVLQQLCGQFDIAPRYYADKNGLITNIPLYLVGRTRELL